MKLLFRAGQTFFIDKIQLLSESGNLCSSKWHIWIKQVLFVRERGLKWNFRSIELYFERRLL